MPKERFGHLLVRFWDVASAPALTETERSWLISYLSESEQAAFFAQPQADQRHGYHSGRWLAARSRRDLVRASVLHDIGKRQCGLGLWGRSLATAWILVGGRTRGRWRDYADHGRLAAAELEALGAEPLVVQFARHHHGARPTGIDPEDWHLLKASDRARPFLGARQASP